ncbi:hypothetical protein [Roseateles sp.]|uniref:hypothetical protein n=1 Tax=Roseateles sp. TaxID=1971397 RepID=UPI0025CF6952|nr:hypothetical protein [Roseateles sp.]MBV8033765.1 hypothetical protein [Roseateles sp.]
MRIALNQTIVDTMSLDEIPIPTKPVTFKDPPPPKVVVTASGAKVEKGLANYLVYDNHNDAPPGFAVRVGKKASVYLVGKLVAGPKLKIPVAVAPRAQGKRAAAAHRASSEAGLGSAPNRQEAWSEPQDLPTEMLGSVGVCALKSAG